LAAEDIERRRRLLQQWRRHSTLIKVLRKLLPALCLGILAVLAGWAVINTLAARREGRRPPSSEIRMLNPSFQGRTEAGKPFLVTMASAMRDNADASKLTLEKPVLTMSVGRPDWTTVKAAKGVYREDTHMLDLRGQVTVDDYRGNHFVTEHAVVNTIKSDVDGDTPIAGHGPLGSLEASSYSLRDGGAYLHFEGRVKARIVQHNPPAPAPAPGGH
jgi:lipopolysaccharide export system protein LptC